MSWSRKRKRKHDALRRLMLICGAFLSFSVAGCMGGKREVSIVFTGESLIARVATNKKIPLVIRQGDRTFYAKKDVGQAVVIPLHKYRALLRAAKKGAE